jgi:dTDP-4-amino-4,6-dideoxygalactose transaminase
MVTTNDSGLAEKIRMITSHGSRKKYFHEILGVNSRLDSIQAAILNVKLRYLDQYCMERCKAADKYSERLGSTFKKPYALPHVKHIYHQYSIRVKNRDAMQKYLAERGIPSMIYYPVPLHLQQAYKYDYKKGDFPVSEMVAGDIISLPMHTELTNDQIDYICENIIKFNSD